LADTLDHVVPLVRGGTNYEGNLVPACRKCNSSKAAWLLTEWKYGRKPAVATVSVVWAQARQQRKAARPIKALGQIAWKVCEVCGALHDRRGATCSDRCLAVRKRLWMREYGRNKYRSAHGIPLDAPKYEPKRVYEHGTNARYKRGCRCDVCRERHNAARRKTAEGSVKSDF
jgi:hypothetical protein